MNPTEDVQNVEQDNLIFNYSSITLTKSMKSLLNKGLNFSILPKKLDLTQVLVDFDNFKRKTIWKEFWYGHEESSERKEPIFKSSKNNLPKKHSTPKGLIEFLCAVKSELMDPKNRNAVEPNLPKDEIKAMTELIELIKAGKIVIKQNDKGSGIMIMDFDIYIKACIEHLESKQLNENNELKPHYEKVSHAEIVTATRKVEEILREGLETNILSKEEFSAMMPNEKDAAKFYCNFKVHKEHTHGEAPPVRPIVSASGSALENVGKFVEFHIKNLANTHKSYLQDTPDFLRAIEQTKEKKLPKNAILASFDVKALYTNIKHEEGLQSLKNRLRRQLKPEIEPDYIVRMMEVLLKQNIFSFEGSYYRQLIGAQMGGAPAPSYANIFVAENIDGEIEKQAIKYNSSVEALQLMKRFLDDIFALFCGSTKDLHKLLDDMNNINPTMKFTLSHTSIEGESKENKCDCDEQSKLPFLDTLCYIKNGQIETDLYRKETDRNQYLLPTSCHNKQTTRNLPFSLSTRIVRICSEVQNRNKRLGEMKQHLLNRNYDSKVIEIAIGKAKSLNRKTTLNRKIKTKQSERPVFAVAYDPRLPAIQPSMAKH